MEPREIREHGTRSASAANTWLVVLLVLLTGVMVWRSVADLLPSRLHDPNAVPRPVIARGDLAEDEKSTIELFRNASPSVVNVTTLDFRRNDISRNLEEIPQGSGSGFLWDDEGHVVTNFHVIREARAARVVMADNSVLDAQLVGVAPDKDLAVLKIDAPKSRLQPLAVGESRNLQVGQKVFAIGSPFSLDQTLTTGVISGLGREIQSLTKHPISDMIQTDAAINPGNSGGPLLDSAGRLIGVNTAIYSPSGAYVGIGFAVPVDTVNRIVPQLIRTGTVERVGLGIKIVDDSLMERFVALGVLPRKGVLVGEVVPGGAAEKAGLKEAVQTRAGIRADLLVGLDGKSIESAQDLYRVLDARNAGDMVAVEVLRDGQTVKLDVTLQVLESASP